MVSWWWLLPLMLEIGLQKSEATSYYLNAGYGSRLRNEPTQICFVTGYKREFCFPFGKRLSNSEYARMPPIYHMDEYEPCLLRAGGRYCSVSFDLVSDAPSELYTMIQEYSAHSLKHFNHTKLRYGICVTQTCKQFLRENTTVDLDETLEACLNETLWRDYKLKSKLNDKVTCNEPDEKVELDVLDIAVATVCVILLLLNFVGSFYGFCCVNTRSNQGKRFLECFSIRSNWRRLVSPTPESDPRLSRLKGLYGIRAWTIMLVISVHAIAPFALAIDNTRDYEEMLNINIVQILSSGSVVLQTFFLISGFFLMYNVELYAEKHAVRWTMLPKGILLRWLRLTPPMAMMIAVASVLPHFSLPFHGPFWELTVGQEGRNCRREWWRNLLYINNYFNGPPCKLETWYLAADTQLYVVGLAVCVLTTGLGRKVTLTMLFLAGILLPAAHTYWQDLDSTLMVTPELVRNLFIEDDTFNILYIRGHTNLVCFVSGLALGLLVCHLHKTNFTLQTPGHQKYRYAFWATVPAIILLMWVGSLFYREHRAPLYMRVLYAALFRPVYVALLGGIIIGMVFKLETVYRGILEWSGWAVPARLSYCAYLLHVTYIRLLHGNRSSLLHSSYFSCAEQIVVTLVVAFLMAIPYWLLVEAPISQLVKLGFSKERRTVNPKTNVDDKYTEK